MMKMGGFKIPGNDGRRVISQPPAMRMPDTMTMRRVSGTTTRRAAPVFNMSGSKATMINAD
jgi:hypothetical protein